MPVSSQILFTLYVLNTNKLKLIYISNVFTRKEDSTRGYVDM